MPHTIPDSEIMRIIKTIQAMMTKRYRGNPRANEFVELVPYSVAVALQKYDPDRSPNLFSFVLTCVQNSLSDYGIKYFYTSRNKTLKPTAAFGETDCDGNSILDRLIGSDVNAADEFVKIRVRDEIAKLSDSNRKIIELTFYEGMNASEIGRSIGISQQAVSQRFDRTIAALRDKLIHLCHERVAKRRRCADCQRPTPGENHNLCNHCKKIHRSMAVSRYRNKKRNAA